MKITDLIGHHYLAEALSFVDMWQIENWVVKLFAKQNINLQFQEHALVRADQRSSNVSAELIYSVFFTILEKNAIGRAYRSNQVTYDDRGRPQMQDAVVSFQHRGPRDSTLYGGIWFKRRPQDPDTIYIATLAFDDKTPTVLSKTNNRYDLGLVSDDFYSSVISDPRAKDLHITANNKIRVPRSWEPEAEDLLIAATRIYLSNQETYWNDWMKATKDAAELGRPSSPEGARKLREYNNEMRSSKNGWIQATKTLRDYIDALKNHNLLDPDTHSQATEDLITRPLQDPQTYKTRAWKSEVTRKWSAILNARVAELGARTTEVWNNLLKKVRMPQELFDYPWENPDAVKNYTNMAIARLRDNLKSDKSLQDYVKTVTNFEAVIEQFDLRNRGLDTSPHNLQAPTVHYTGASRDETEYTNQIKRTYIDHLKKTVNELIDGLERFQPRDLAAYQWPDPADRQTAASLVDILDWATLIKDDSGNDLQTASAELSAAVAAHRRIQPTNKSQISQLMSDNFKNYLEHYANGVATVATQLRNMR